MAILTLLLGVFLLALGFGGLALSVNLIPTEMGMLYALSGVIFFAAAAVVLAIAAMIARIDRISSPRPKPPAVSPVVEPARDDDASAGRNGQSSPRPRAGEAEIVGHYSAGGAKYVIFSDGSIEAETDQGAFRFASMDDFKAYIASRQS